MKTGLFFGSFNPIHMGHLIIANVALSEAPLDQVWFVVSPQNPHKRQSKSLIHEFDRMHMVELSITKNDRFYASDIEFHLPRPNYTIDTLTYLSEKNPGMDFYLIIGEDNLESFPKWKNYNVILENYKLLVYPRPQSDGRELKKHRNVIMVDAPVLDISASYIRKRIREKKSVMYLVPDEVIRFIDDKNLYR